MSYLCPFVLFLLVLRFISVVADSYFLQGYNDASSSNGVHDLGSLNK
jgi:hypothetical protein